MADLPPAILLDMDDTILVVSGSARRVWTRIAEDFAAALAPLSPEDVVAAIEGESQRLWNDTAWNRHWRVRLAEARRHVVASAFAVFAGAGQPVPETEVGDKMADLFTMIRDEELSVFPRAHEALDGLKRLWVRLALITNGATGQGYPVCSRRAVRPCSDRGRARIRQTRRARLYPFNGGARCRASRHVDGRGQPRTGNRSSAAPRNLRDLHDGYGTGLPPGYPIRPDWIIHSLTELIL